MQYVNFLSFKACLETRIYQSTTRAVVFLYVHIELYLWARKTWPQKQVCDHHSRADIIKHEILTHTCPLATSSNNELIGF